MASEIDVAPQAGRGCALTMVCVNLSVMGFVALGFGSGPYSSHEQLLWYRYGSLAFFIFGAVVPAVVVFLGRRSQPWIITAATVWLLVIWLPFVCYMFLSGGGV